MVIAFWFIYQNNIYTDTYYKLPQSEQLIIELNDRLKFSIMFFGLIFLVHFFNMPNEIHRANMLNKNWKIRICILIAFYVVYIALCTYFYIHKEPSNLQSTFLILIISNFVFGANPYATNEEEKLGEPK